jgi:hypothetical protein
MQTSKAPLPQPAPGHAVGVPTRLERIASDKAIQKRKKETATNKKAQSEANAQAKHEPELGLEPGSSP